jgi:glycosyltransferase involved in cell wall biosynthesis
MLDITFFQKVYAHILSANNIIQNTEKIKEYYTDNPHLYFSKKDFYERNPEFDWIFYSNIYGLKKNGYVNELDVIMYYIRYNNELNLINQDYALNYVKNISYDIDSKYLIQNKKILMISHELSLTGAPLVLDELCNLYGLQNTIHLINLNPNLKTLQPSYCTIVGKDTIKFLDYDIVIINTIAENVFIYLDSINYTYNDNTILWIHELGDNYYNNILKYASKFRFAIGLVDSVPVKNKLVEKLPNLCKLYKVQNLVNTAKLNLKEHNIMNNIKIGNFGTLSCVKNQMQIITALETCISNGNNNITLYLVKQNNDYYKIINNYINYSQHKNILKDKVIFMDEIGGNDMQQLYNLIDVYVSSSTNEAFGKTLIESMECGLPIIAYNAGSHKVLIEHDFNGYIYNNITELASYLNILSKNHDLIKKIGINNHIVYKLIYGDINRYTNDWNKIFSCIINKYSNRTIKLNKIFNEKSVHYETLECISHIYKNKLYIFGGYVLNKNISQTIRIVDLETKTKYIVQIPNTYAFTHFCTTMIDNYVYNFSGQYEDGYGHATNICYKFNLDTHMIEYVCECPFKTYCSRAICNDKINVVLLVGANNDRACGFNEVWKYNLDENKWTYLTENNYGLIHTGSIVYNNELYILGGNYDHAICNQPTLAHICKDVLYLPRDEIFKLCNDTYKLKHVSTLPIKKSHLDDSVCEYNGMIYIFGGQIINDCVTNDITVYIPEIEFSFNIHISEISKYVLKGTSVKIYNNKLLIFGGQFGSGCNNKVISKFSDELSIFDLC